MVSEWRGILAGQAILICMTLANVQVVFGWWVYGVVCVVACCISLAIFGMGRALGKRLSERTIGWWLVLNGLLPLCLAADTSRRFYAIMTMFTTVVTIQSAGGV